MKKLKVLLVTHLYSRNGSSYFSGSYHRIAHYLGRLHHVDLLTSSSEDGYEKKENFNVIYRKTPGSDLFLQRRLALSFYASRLARNYDLVHGLFDICGFFPSFSYPTIVTEHAVKELDSKIWMYYKAVFQKIMYQKSKKIICVSRNLVKILEEKYRVPAVFIPHGIDIDDYYPFKEDKELKRSLLKNKFKHLCVVCGMYAINKRVLFSMIGAFKNILFLRISKPERKRKYPNLVYLSGITEEKKKKFYSIADFVFKPINFSSASNTILEAMAMGKVNITNKTPGITDYLNDKCAYLAKTNEDFIDLFRKALRNKNEREYKGREARKRAEKYFSWEVVAKKVSGVYHQILENSNKLNKQ